MGYIKKLKSNELVGGTDKTTIYPVTSTEAVFEEATNGSESSFKSQKTINKKQQDELDDHEERIQAAEAEDIKSITINGSTKKFEVDDENNVDLTIYTVDNDPDMPDIADNVRDLRNMVGTSTPVLGTSHKTRIETLEGGESVTGSVENKIKTKVDSINSSYQDDDNEYVKYSMTQTSGKVTDFNIDETSLKNAITSLNTSISGDNIIVGPRPTTGLPGKIYRVVNSSNNTYTDYMYSNGSWITLAIHDTSDEQAQVAYYTCTAAGSGAQATKQFVSNGSLEYTPSSGGHIKILMGEANTATGTIYLQFGTTASTKKPLYYNGEPVSPGNTWEENEVISVYYDGSVYQASNAQGGGNDGKKKLGFTEPNKVIDTSGEYIGTSGIANGWQYIKYAVSEGDVVVVSGNGGNGARLWAIAESNGHILSRSDANTSENGKVLVMPADAAWIVLNSTIATAEWYYAKAGSTGADAILGKIAKYTSFDNSQSGLTADNVQGALDEVSGKVFVGEKINLTDDTTSLSYYISGSSPYNWSASSQTYPYYCRIKPINANTRYRLTALDDNPAHFALLNTNVPNVGYPATDWNNGAPKRINAGNSVVIDSGEYTYLYVRNNIGSTASDFKYPRIEVLEDVNTAVEEMQEEIEDTLGSDYLGTDMLEPGGVNNNTGDDASETNNSHTKYLPLGDATSVIIYNYGGKSVDGHTLYFKYMWYDVNKVYKGYQTWTSATTAQVPSGAVGGYVRIVFSRNPSAATTPSNIAQFELFLNIYGHDTLVKRVEALEAKAEDDDTSMTAQLLKCVAPDTITFCTWNIGHFSGGASSSSSITGSNYDTKLSQFRDLIYNTINPRVIALNEYSAVFGTDANSVSHNARDVLFNDFLIKYEGSQSNYSCNAMFASTYLVNMKMQRFDCLPHETIAGGYQDDYYYIIADLYMAGRLIKLVSSHFANTKQADQASELVSKLSSYDKVIVTGDLNTYGSSLSVFTNDGYTIGNTSINTYQVPNPTMPLDNIIYKGVVVSDIRAIDSTLSDHKPLVATITV